MDGDEQAVVVRAGWQRLEQVGWEAHRVSAAWVEDAVQAEADALTARQRRRWNVKAVLSHQKVGALMLAWFPMYAARLTAAR